MADVPEPDISPELFAALAADPLAAQLGIVLEQVSPGYARASMTVGPAHLNAAGTAHGGATMALLDVVHAAVSNSHGTLAVAQDVHTEFLSPGRPGDVLVAEGTEVHRSARTAVYRIEARASDHRLVATALARVFRLGTPWELPGEEEVVAMTAPPPVPPTMQLSQVAQPLPTPGEGTNPSGELPPPDELR
ncbi:hotdog fold thioesterase [Klenkia brasiliensis]|uniref:Acyl-CoA thioesterase n=1 Tax=Klenkia brasiliensis TaxID=333142 RepID=A0A1G7MP31_9ACTN|nr:hotdog fold thioesterase [Klenkia brasiliensis]SDF62880.1 acyl-CoA thioesterase [Klenkia brasiliensis]